MPKQSPEMSEILRQATFDEISPEYGAFVEKFKPKKTTDDCYTPPPVYDAIRDWAVEYYGLQGREIVRPFFPGGDFETFAYPAGCVVLDNPPFSILSRILRFYNSRKIDYFLFAPTLTLFSSGSGAANYVVCGATITYDNGAEVNTSFATSLGKYKIEVSGELYKTVTAADEKNQAATKKPELPKYEYPDCILTAARFQCIAKRGLTLRVPAEAAAFVRGLDAQRDGRTGIFGAGFIVADGIAQLHRITLDAAAERAAATVWRLSPREREIQKLLERASPL